MKNTIQLSTLLFFVVMFFGCGNPDSEKNTDETQASDTTTTQIRSEARQNRAGTAPDSLSASQVVDTWIENLDERLSLSPEVKAQIKDIYLAEYMKSGDSADTQIKKEEAKEMRATVVRNTQNEVNALLTAEQKEFYARYIR